MNLNQVFLDYFNKSMEERDEVLSNVAKEYLRTCVDNLLSYDEIIYHTNVLINQYVQEEKYEQADGFKQIRDNLIEIYKELKNNENGKL